MRLIGYKYFSPECDSIRQIHLKREDYNLTNILRMMSKIYADNFARSKSDSSRGSAERGVATQAIGQDLSNTSHLYCNKFGYYSECFNDWGRRRYDDSVPGEVTKTTSSGDRAT